MSDREDQELLDQLRAVGARFDPVPPEVVAAARSAIAWKTMDAELAELVGDSHADDERLVSVRSGALATLLTFSSPGLTVEIEILASGGRRRVLGQLVPPQTGQVEVRHRGGRLSVTADEVGRFTVDDLPPGPVSLRCQAAGGPQARVVETDWFLA